MSVLDSYSNILCCALKPRESKRLQAAGQWSINALGGVGWVLSGVTWSADGHHPYCSCRHWLGAQVRCALSGASSNHASEFTKPLFFLMTAMWAISRDYGDSC
jgi:hypothetical protein